MKNNQMMVLVVVVILAALGFFLLNQMQMVEKESVMEEVVEETMAPEATPLDPSLMEDKESQDTVIDDEVEQIESQLDALDETVFDAEGLDEAGVGL